jgi:hypothetical protein
MKSDDSALSLDANIFLHDIEKADILVGIPSFNNVLTASYVINQAVKGLEKYFPNYRSVIFVSDGNSKDDTLNSVKRVNLPSEIKLIPAIYMGISGKGRAVRAIFEAASKLGVKSVALVDSDLRSITPEWMKLLIEPTLLGTGFVAPYYNRRKYDGTITNFLCYPLICSLFGKDIRQPIGGDFGLSRELVEDILDSSLWEIPDVCRFGIDIFETITALTKGHEVKQAYLGIKEHDAKDPSSQLASMFRQVINTMFTAIETCEAEWKSVKGFSETEMVGKRANNETPEPIKVSLEETMTAYKTGYPPCASFFSSFLEPDLISAFEKLKDAEISSNVVLSSEVWVKTVYSFLAKFHRTPLDEREFLINSLRVLWIGRVGSFIKETLNESREQAEARVVEEAKVFRQLKPYLLEKY